MTSYSFFEGFGHYTEQMMLDEGFGGNDPKLRLFQLKAALQRICRYIVGIKMHTEMMSIQEAIEFFISNAYMERVNAEREAMRGTIDPMYLAYTLGKLQVLKLREDYRKFKRSGYSLREFHDNLLSYGYPPVKILRMITLPGDNEKESAVDLSI